MTSRSTHCWRCTSRRSAGDHPGFTLIESVMSIIIVGVMLVASLSVLANTRQGRRIIADQGRGNLLAEHLMSEIVGQAYEEPTDSVVFGLEVNEAADSRAAWDDVDDYDSWSASPPQHNDGTVMTGLEGWERRVDISFVAPSALSSTSASDSGVKRIAVTVLHDGRQVAKLFAIRTGARDDSSSKLDQLTVAVE